MAQRGRECQRVKWCMPAGKESLIRPLKKRTARKQEGNIGKWKSFDNSTGAEGGVKC